MDQNDVENGSLRQIVVSLIRSNGERWLKFALRILGSPEDAEDVLQEAVHRVLVRDLPFQSEDEIRKYLSRAISNTTIELYHVRKREKLRSRPLNENSLVAPGSFDPQYLLENWEVSRRDARVLSLLEDGLASLPLKQYEAVQLTLLEPGLRSIREAGTERGIPYSTLRHRKLQGIRRLRKYVRKALKGLTLKLILA